MDTAHAENDSGHGATGGATRRLARVTRIARHAGQWTIGDALPTELWHRGLAEDDCSLLAQSSNRRRIMRCRGVRRELRSKAGGHAGDEKIVLDANRHTIDQTAWCAHHPTRLGIPRASEGTLAIHPAIVIHNFVVPIDLIEDGTKHLDRRK